MPDGAMEDSKGRQYSSVLVSGPRMQAAPELLVDHRMEGPVTVELLPVSGIQHVAL